MIVVEGGVAAHRPGPRRRGHPGAPDRRRADDLRAAAPRLTAAGRPTAASRRRRRRRRAGRRGGWAASTSCWRRSVAGRCSNGRWARSRRRPTVDRIVVVTRAGAGRRAGRRAVAAAVGRDVVAGGPDAPDVGGRRPRCARRAERRLRRRPDRVVLVHDGARPLVTPALVDAVVLAAAEHGAAIPVLPVAETVKRVVGGVVVETVERAALATAQTPQGARRSLLRDGIRRASRPAASAASRTKPPCWRPVPSPSMRSRRTHEPQGDAPRRPSPRRRIARRRSHAHRVRSRQPSVRTGPAARPRRRRGRRRAAAPRALRRRRRAARRRRRAPRCGRPRRSRAALPGRRADAERDRLRRSCSARSSPGSRGAGYRPSSVDVTVLGARPRLADRLDAMRDTIAASWACPRPP